MTRRERAYLKVVKNEQKIKELSIKLGELYDEQWEVQDDYMNCNISDAYFQKRMRNFEYLNYIYRGQIEDLTNQNIKLRNKFSLNC